MGWQALAGREAAEQRAEEAQARRLAAEEELAEFEAQLGKLDEASRKGQEEGERLR